MSAVGDPTIIFPLAGQKMVLGATDTATTPSGWFADMSSTVNGMRTVNDQLAAAIVARSQQLQHQAFESAVLTAVVTVAVVLLVLLATALVARSMVNPLRRLQTDALEIASVRLPARVAAAASGTDLAEADPASFGYVEPIGVQGTDEIARVARAFDQVHAEAVRLAGTEAQLRSNLNTMFISLSRRSVPLIDRLSRMIDNLEQNEADSEQLSHLFSMDHLVTRMRRNSENLLVLAGEEPVRKWSEPVPLGRRGPRRLGRDRAVRPGVAHGPARDHGLRAGGGRHRAPAGRADRERHPVLPPGEPDSGVGRGLARRRRAGRGHATRGSASPRPGSTEMNWRLDHPPGVDVSVSRHMGLFAVSRLAARHGIRVRLRAGSPQGLTALVWLPGNLTSREQPLTVGMHSRPRPEGTTFNEVTAFGDDPTPALGAALEAAHGTSGLRQRTTGRPGRRAAPPEPARHQRRPARRGRRRGGTAVGVVRGQDSVRPAARPGPRPRLRPRLLRPPLPVPRSPGLRPRAAAGGPAGVDWSASGPADPGLRSADLGGWPGGGPPGRGAGHQTDPGGAAAAGAAIERRLRRPAVRLRLGPTGRGAGARRAARVRPRGMGARDPPGAGDRAADAAAPVAGGGAQPAGRIPAWQP